VNHGNDLISGENYNTSYGINIIIVELCKYKSGTAKKTWN